MDGPDALDLAGATGSERGYFADGVTGGAQRDNSLVGGDIRCATSVFSGHFGKLDPLALLFAPGFVVVAGHLQGELQKQILRRVEHNPRNAFACGGEVGEIDQAGHRELRPLGPDRGDQLFGFGEGKPADAVDLFGDDDFARLQVRDHAQQFGPVRAGARRLFAVDPSYVVTGGSSALFDLALAGEVLLVGRDAQVDAGNFDRGVARWGVRHLATLNHMVNRRKRRCYLAITYLAIHPALSGWNDSYTGFVHRHRTKPASPLRDSRQETVTAAPYPGISVQMLLRPQRLLRRLEKRMEALKRVKLAGYEVAIAELEVERNLLLRARRYLETGLGGG